jgi:hypothetical protein
MRAPTSREFPTPIRFPTAADLPRTMCTRLHSPQTLTQFVTQISPPGSSSNPACYMRLSELLDKHSQIIFRHGVCSMSGRGTQPNVFEDHEAIDWHSVTAALSVRAYPIDPAPYRDLAASLIASGRRPDQPGQPEPPALRRRRRVASSPLYPRLKTCQARKQVFRAAFLQTGQEPRTHNPSIIPSCSMNFIFANMRTKHLPP